MLATSIAFTTNIILTILTGFYVVITYKLVTESRKANEINRQFAEEQVRVVTSPYIHPEVRISGKRLFLVLANGSQVPAYDVDVWISGYYNFDEIKQYFLSQDNEKSFDDDDLVYVFDHIVYPVFPNNRQVIAELDFPVITDSVNVFIQYRDTRALNYLYNVWFLDDTDGQRKSYQIGAIDPSGKFVSERLDIFKEIDEKVERPTYINSFIENFKNRVIIRTPNSKQYYIEDRGEWKSLS